MTSRIPRRAGRIVLLQTLSLSLVTGAHAQFPLCTQAENGWLECRIDGSDELDGCGGANGADGVNVADVDYDGDLDVVTGWEESKNAFIYFNPLVNTLEISSTETCRGQWPLVDVSGGFTTTDVEDVTFGDLDADGVIDSIISSNEKERREVGVHALKPGMAIEQEGSWVGEQLPGEDNYYMTAAVDRIRPRYGDGSVKTCNDIVAGAKGSEIEVTVSAEVPLPDTEGELPDEIEFPDLDLSLCDALDPITELPGIPDKCFHGGIWWWECPKASEGGPFGDEWPAALKLGKWEKRKIHDAFWIMSLELVDMDGDGDRDVLFSDRRKVGWFENRTSPDQGANLEGWGDPIEIEHMRDLRSVGVDAEGDRRPFPGGGPYRYLTRADLDGDGLEDIVATVNFSLETAIGNQAVGRWYRRLDVSGRSWASYWIFPTDPEFVSAGNPQGIHLPYGPDGHKATVSKAVAVADFDEDGSLDLAFAVRGSGTGVYLLTQRPGGPTGQLWNTHKIAIPREDYKFDNLKVVDIDGDGDLDILSSDENVGPDSHGLGVVYYANPLREANRAPLARCGTVVVAADTQCSSQFASIDNGSSDPNTADDLARVQSPAGPYGLGITWVGLAVIDPQGFYDVCLGSVDHRDLSAPQLSCSSGPVQLECAAPTGTAAAYTFGATDNCDPAPVSSCSIPQGSLLGLGTTRSECVATDRDGNQAGCSVLLRVVDTLRPDVVAPGAIVTECASASGTSVALGAATASDRCDGPRSVTNDAPALFPGGATTVTWTARDVAANVGTATQLVTVRDTAAPAITAPAAGTFECTSPAGYPKSGIGSPVTSDTCDPAPQVTSDAPTTLPLGVHTIVWTARDDANNAASTSQAVTVIDTAAPSVSCPADVTVECTGDDGVRAADRQLASFLASATASDVCDASVTLSNDAPSFFGLGTRAVTTTARDDSGNSASCVADVTVADTVPPTIHASVSPTTLWVPDHKMVDLTASVSVVDGCDPRARFVLTSITSDEPDNGTGDGDTPSDVQGAAFGTADTRFRLRAERSALGDGRTYTITYTAIDGSGNTAVAVLEVVVPFASR
jgi:hypothetical protein